MLLLLIVAVVVVFVVIFLFFVVTCCCCCCLLKFFLFIVGFVVADGTGGEIVGSFFVVGFKVEIFVVSVVLDCCGTGACSDAVT